MSWMGVEFPPRIALGLLCEPGWSVRVVTTMGGRESRNLNWTEARHRYDAGLAVRTATDYQVVLAHFHMARAQTHSWPLKDPVDYRCEQAAGILLQAGDDSPQGVQLHKRYGSGAFAYDRKITRPRQSTILVFRAGALQTEGVHYTLNYDTGIIVPPAGVALTEFAWSGQFYVPTRYDIDKMPGRVVNRRPGGGDLLLEATSIPLLEVRE